MKKTIVLLAVLAMSVSVAACGSKQEEVSTTTEMTQEMSSESAEIASTEPVSTENVSTESASTETMTTEAAGTETSTSFEDNFAVDSKTAADFGVKIKKAVAAKDLELLSELVAYPTYVGFDDGLIVETKEDFLSLDKDKLFTEEMLASIAGADETALTASKAGFTLQTEGITPSITYSVVDGELGIVGINY